MRHARILVLAAGGLSLLLTALVWAEAIPYTAVSAATDNATLVKAGRATVRVLLATNTATTIRRVKLYDVSAVPNCGTDAVKVNLEVPPASAAGQLAGSALDFPGGVQFQHGIGLCIVTGQAATDDTAGSAGDVVVNLFYD